MMTNNKKLISIIIPAYNEQESIVFCNKRISDVMNNIVDKYDYEIIYINDGSKDATAEIIKTIRASDPHIALIDLSRNFGKEIAMIAGIDNANGDAVIILDADLQDPPELIVDFLREWENGFDCVYGKRLGRKGETWFKKATAHMFYRIIRKMSRVDIPQDTGDFRLLSRRAVLSLRKLRENQRFSKGLFAWIGYPTKEITYERDARIAGSTKWNYLSLAGLAIEGITSFSTVPLKFSTIMGMVAASWAFLYLIWILIRASLYGDAVKGYPSLVAIILFFSGIQLLSLGIIGEYIGRIYNESKQRPLYLLNEYCPSKYNPSTHKNDIS